MQESYDRARSAHDEFQAARQRAIADLIAKRREIDARIRELAALGRISMDTTPKKRGRPPKDAKRQTALEA